MPEPLLAVQPVQSKDSRKQKQAVRTTVFPPRVAKVTFEKKQQ
jgi:hypothetical protein